MKIFIKILFLTAFIFFAAPHFSRAALLSRPANNLGLVGYWPMDEGVSNTAGDSSASRNAGTVTGANWVGGKHGKALSFDNTDKVDLATTSLPAGSSDRTIAAWIYHTTNGDWQMIFNYGTPASGNGFAFGFGNSADQNKLIVGRYNQNSGVSTLGVPLNQWTHVAAAFAGGNVSFYINGMSAGTTTLASVNTTLTSARIGRSVPNWDGADGNYTFSGYIDDVRIYNRALSASDVYNLYKSGQVTRKVVSNQNLLGYWSFNEGRGNKAGDSSGNGFTAILSGSALPTWSGGKRGQALRFSGSNSYVAIASTTPTGDNFSVSVWAMWNSFSSGGGDSVILHCGAGGNDTIYLAHDVVLTGRLNFNAYNGSPVGIYHVGGASVTTGQWYNIVGTHSSNLWSLYVNGNFVASTTGTSVVGSYMDCGVGSLSTGGRYMNGFVDDLRIYNRTLSAVEARALYAQNETSINHSQNSRLTDGLVGQWSFNGPDYNSASTTAEVLDRSGNNNNGDNIGGVTAIGKTGQALSFDGSSNQYVKVARGVSDDFTLSLWFKARANSPNHSGSIQWYQGNGLIDGEVGGIVNDFGMSYLDNKAAFGIGNPDTTILSTSTISSGWHHIVGTRIKSTGAIALYIDGVLENSGTGNTNSLNAGSFIYFGSSNGGVNTYGSPNAIYDEVRIYNRALSASEVYQLYNLGR